MNECIFCKIVNKQIPAKVIYEDEELLCFLDINPICDGHCLIIPKKHYETVYDIPSDILQKSLKLSKDIFKLTEEVTSYKGGSLTYNYGDKQEIKHAHMHIMPNYNVPKKYDIDVIYQKFMEKINEKTN